MQKNQKKYLGAITLTVMLIIIGSMLFSSNPKRLVIPKNWKDNKEFLEKARKLKDEDKQLFMQAIARDAFSTAFGRGEVIIPGTTIGKVIEEQKAFSGNREEQAEKEESLRREVKEKSALFKNQVKDSITVTLVDKQLIKQGYSDFIETKIAYKNTSPKDIAGIKGSMVFKDIFDDVIITISSSMDETIKAGDTYVTKGYGIDFNQFTSEHKKLASTPMDKLKFDYIPQAIVFTDGSKLSVEDIK